MFKATVCWLLAPIAAIAVAGCASTSDQIAALQAKRATLQEQYDEAAKACDTQFSPTNERVAVNRARCLNDALSVGPHHPADLLRAFTAERLEIAERVQSGKITVAQGEAEAAEKWSAMVGEQQRRAVSIVGAAAQVESAAAASSSAAAAWRGPGPRTCNYGNGTVNCY
jgi:hypothetical protein